MYNVGDKLYYLHDHGIEVVEVTVKTPMTVKIKRQYGHALVTSRRWEKDLKPINAETTRLVEQWKKTKDDIFNATMNHRASITAFEKWEQKAVTTK
jgi:hypothetical protein